MRFQHCFNINENEDLIPHTRSGWEDQMSFVLRENETKYNKLQRGHKNRATGELKIYHKAPRVRAERSVGLAFGFGYFIFFSK